jgi:hypothetical protein
MPPIGRNLLADATKRMAIEIAVEKEGDIDCQRRIRRLIDFDDQDGKGADHRQTGCEFEPARPWRHKTHDVKKTTLMRAL